jgi:hypothetical protein
MGFQFDARPDLASAVALIVPGGRYTIVHSSSTDDYHYEDIVWHHQDDYPDWVPPSKEYVEGYLKSIQDIWDEKVKYQKLREKMYPPIGDQLDALWKGGQAAADMKAKIQAVKDHFRKGDNSHPWRGSAGGTIAHYYKKGSSSEQHPSIPLPEVTHPVPDPNAVVSYQGEPAQLSLPDILK